MWCAGRSLQRAAAILGTVLPGIAGVLGSAWHLSTCARRAYASAYAFPHAIADPRPYRTPNTRANCTDSRPDPSAARYANTGSHWSINACANQTHACTNAGATGHTNARPNQTTDARPDNAPPDAASSQRAYSCAYGAADPSAIGDPNPLTNTGSSGYSDSVANTSTAGYTNVRA